MMNHRGLYSAAMVAILLAGRLTSVRGQSNSNSSTAQPAGASVAFTSDDPTIVRCRGLIETGEFANAGILLDLGKAADLQAADEMREIMARIRSAYSTDAPHLLEKIRGAIPGVSIDDLDRWREAGELDYRTIDGTIFYFNREPANLFRFCEEAKRRRTPAIEQKPDWTIEQHLARVVAAAKTAGPLVVPIRHRITYSLTVPADAPGFKTGARVRVWLPFPQEYRQQGQINLIGTSPAYTLLAPSARDEANDTGAAQRTIYFEKQVDDPAHPLTFSEVFEYTCAAYYPQLEDARAQPLPGDYGEGDMGERLPHIAFTPTVKDIVAKVVGSETNALIKARKIFHYVCRNIAYCAEEEYGTIPSLSIKALSKRRGDCGVQGITFITLCRAAGIPARWQTGWETKRVGTDFHDWCEFYVAPWGWLPCDPSYGLQTSEDPAIREFYFGHLDSYRLIVNRDYGRELIPSKQSLRSEPMDFQRGEVEIDGKNLYFTHWDFDMNVEWLSDGP
jgi:transglutaminase-like putative cysteine protease